ncbi:MULTISPECIES: phosphatase PAP2 family protein [Cupriavidus]|uniref:phosphatase PAP2 family protein n=1 Tax=Cupriavidus TaxID=106589 RepID=UPI0009ECFED4|nr:MULTISPECIES: phosphatase PAP2 family protein [Cupriavidus]BDB30538.1 phosphatase PAP2 family protein [Cupriavidus sp. P-10]
MREMPLVQTPASQRWLRQQWWMLASAALVLAYVFQRTELDLWLEGRFYDVGRTVFPLRQHWLFEAVLHKGAKWLTYVAVAAAMGVCWRGWRGRLPWLPRRNALLAAAGMVVIPLSVTLLKLMTGRHCPWDMAQFGGSLPYMRLLDPLPADVKPGQCFPAGHAATGFLWVVWGIALRPAGRRWAWVGLAGGLLLGGTLGAARMAQGAHFLSHTLATLWVAWAVSLLLARGLRANVRLGSAAPHQGPKACPRRRRPPPGPDSQLSRDGLDRL